MNIYDAQEQALMELSKLQREIYETPFQRRVRMVIDATGCTEEEAEAMVENSLQDAEQNDIHGA